MEETPAAAARASTRSPLTRPANRFPLSSKLSPFVSQSLNQPADHVSRSYSAVPVNRTPSSWLFLIASDIVERSMNGRSSPRVSLSMPTPAACSPTVTAPPDHSGTETFRSEIVHPRSPLFWSRPL